MDANLSAESLQSARAKANLTLEQIATQLGLTRQAVSAWERGVSTPSGSARILLGQLFNVDRDVIDSWFERERETA